MKVTPDTNVLVRACVADDARQAEQAVSALAAADMVAISLHSLCEFAWVLARAYGVGKPDIASTIRKLVDTAKVVTDRPAVEAGLAMLEAGGDFADGVIAYEGRWLGGSVFLSFDRKAVALLSAQRHDTELLS